MSCLSCVICPCPLSFERIFHSLRYCYLCLFFSLRRPSDDAMRKMRRRWPCTLDSIHSLFHRRRRLSFFHPHPSYHLSLSLSVSEGQLAQQGDCHGASISNFHCRGKCTELGKTAGPRLRGSQEAGFTQPRAHSFAQPCRFQMRGG